MTTKLIYATTQIKISFCNTVINTVVRVECCSTLTTTVFIVAFCSTVVRFACCNMVTPQRSDCMLQHVDHYGGQIFMLQHGDHHGGQICMLQHGDHHGGQICMLQHGDHHGGQICMLQHGDHHGGQICMLHHSCAMFIVLNVEDVHCMCCYENAIYNKTENATCNPHVRYMCSVWFKCYRYTLGMSPM